MVNGFVYNAYEAIVIVNEPVRKKTNNLGSDINRTVQSQKMVRGWKFWI